MPAIINLLELLGGILFVVVVGVIMVCATDPYPEAERPRKSFSEMSEREIRHLYRHEVREIERFHKEYLADLRKKIREGSSR